MYCLPSSRISTRERVHQFRRCLVILLYVQYVSFFVFLGWKKDCATFRIYSCNNTRRNRVEHIHTHDAICKEPLYWMDVGTCEPNGTIYNINNSLSFFSSLFTGIISSGSKRKQDRDTGEKKKNKICMI